MNSRVEHREHRDFLRGGLAQRTRRAQRFWGWGFNSRVERFGEGYCDEQG